MISFYILKCELFARTIKLWPFIIKSVKKKKKKVFWQQNSYLEAHLLSHPLFHLLSKTKEAFTSSVSHDLLVSPDSKGSEKNEENGLMFIESRLIHSDILSNVGTYTDHCHAKQQLTLYHPPAL